MKLKSQALKKNLRKAHTLFKTTLKVKLQYESALEKLYEDADTRDLTKAVIKAVSRKRQSPDMMLYKALAAKNNAK